MTRSTERRPAADMQDSKVPAAIIPVECKSTELLAPAIHVLHKGCSRHKRSSSDKSLSELSESLQQSMSTRSISMGHVHAQDTRNKHDGVQA